MSPATVKVFEGAVVPMPTLPSVNLTVILSSQVADDALVPIAIVSLAAFV